MWVGQWEGPLKGRVPMREEPVEEGVWLGEANAEVLLEGLALERGEGIFCGWVGTAVGRGGGR